MEFKREDFEAHIELKADEEGVFRGLASTFGNMDLTRDVIERGAFAKTLRRRPAKRVKMLAFHNPDEPIGVFRDIEETEKGLQVEGKLTLEVQRAKEIHALMRDGALDAMSIGFRTVRQEFDEERRIRTLKEIDLHEISVVTFPANEKARIRTVKEALRDGELPTEREFEAFLRDAGGFSRERAKEILSKGYRHLLERDAPPLDDNLVLSELRDVLKAARGAN